jgi:hypothetical protein
MRNPRRRRIVFTVITATAFIFVAATNALAQHPTPQPPQPRQSPNAPTNQNVPQGLDGPQLTAPDTNKVPVDTQNDREIRAGVERLYTLVLELKNEVDQTNTNMVLNTSVVKRAQDIEKLAKQIKDRAKK